MNNIILSNLYTKKLSENNRNQRDLFFKHKPNPTSFKTGSFHSIKFPEKRIDKGLNGFLKKI